MEFEKIKKDPGAWKVAPNLLNYEKAYAEFKWDQIIKELDGLPNGGGINIAHEAVDRHANGPKRDQLALRWLGAKEGEVRDFTYGDLKEQTNRFANVCFSSGESLASRSTKPPCGSRNRNKRSSLAFLSRPSSRSQA